MKNIVPIILGGTGKTPPYPKKSVGQILISNEKDVSQLLDASSLQRSDLIFGKQEPETVSTVGSKILGAEKTYESEHFIMFHDFGKDTRMVYSKHEKKFLSLEGSEGHVVGFHYIVASEKNECIYLQIDPSGIVICLDKHFQVKDFGEQEGNGIYKDHRFDDADITLKPKNVPHGDTRFGSIRVFTDHDGDGNDENFFVMGNPGVTLH